MSIYYGNHCTLCIYAFLAVWYMLVSVLKPWRAESLMVGGKTFGCFLGNTLITVLVWFPSWLILVVKVVCPDMYTTCKTLSKSIALSCGGHVTHYVMSGNDSCTSHPQILTVSYCNILSLIAKCWWTMEGMLDSITSIFHSVGSIMFRRLTIVAELCVWTVLCA